MEARMSATNEKQTEQLNRVDERKNSDAFARDVRQGLMKSQKALPCVYFYDTKGSLLFEEICRLPEYYPTRTEASILREYSAEIAGLFSKNVNIIELGSGSSLKTRILLEAFLQKQGRIKYQPIDVSKSILEESSATLKNRYPQLNVLPVTARYEEGLKKAITENDAINLVLWLGSSIGNYEREEAIRFLQNIRKSSSASTKYLIGIDLRKEKHILESAYDDSEGITAAFNLNLLERINRELNADFDRDAFKHTAVYNEKAGKVEIHLVSRKQQAVTIAGCGIEIYFDEGEKIHTENSFKYSLEEISALAKQSGFKIEKQWFDEKQWFSLNLFSIS